MRSPHWTPVFAGHSIRSKADHHQAISRGLGRPIDEAVPVNQTPAFEFMISEGDNGAKGVVLLRANGSLEETKAELTGLAQSHPGTPRGRWSSTRSFQRCAGRRVGVRRVRRGVAGGATARRALSPARLETEDPSSTMRSFGQKLGGNRYSHFKIDFNEANMGW
mgnify:CR=1 FL=1